MKIPTPGYARGWQLLGNFRSQPSRVVPAVVVTFLALASIAVFFSMPRPLAAWDPSVASGNTTAAIIWLHGLGDSPNGAYMRGFVPHVVKVEDLSYARWITPSAPQQRSTCNNGEVMPSWFDMPAIPVHADTPRSDPVDVARAAAMVHAIIDEQVEAGIPPHRIILGGFSQGGATTIVAALTYPRQLGGAAVLWGWIPVPDDDIKKMIQERAEPLTPMLWSHGRQDYVIGYEVAEAGVELLTSQGVPCKLHAYDDKGHHIHEGETLRVAAWMKQRVPPIGGTTP